MPVSFFSDRLPTIALSVLLALLIFLSNASITFYYYVAIVLLVVSPLLIYVGSQQHLKLSNADRMWAAALVLYTGAAALNMWVHGSWLWQEFNEPSKFLVVVVVFFAVRRHGVNEGVFLWSGLLGLAAATIFAWYQSEVLNVGRVYGSTNRIISAFGLIVLITAYFSAIFVLHTKFRPRYQLLAALAILLTMLYTVAATGTKGVWIALPGVAALFVLLKWKTARIGALLGLAAVFSISVMLYWSNDLVHARLSGLGKPLLVYFETGQVTDGSLSIRLETWKASILMFWETPWFGVGLGGFVPEKARLISDGLILPITFGVGGPHNDLVGTLAIQGLVGFAALVFMYSAFLRLCWAYKSQSIELFWCGLGLVVIYSLSGLAGDRLSSNLSATYLALMMAIVAGQMSWKYSRDSELNHDKAQ